MNPDDLASGMLALIAAGTKNASELNAGIFQNAAQALAVIQGNLIHQHGGVGDDPGLIAALQTATRAPEGVKGA